MVRCHVMFVLVETTWWISGVLSCLRHRLVYRKCPPKFPIHIKSELVPLYHRERRLSKIAGYLNIKSLKRPKRWAISSRAYYCFSYSIKVSRVGRASHRFFPGENAAWLSTKAEFSSGFLREALSLALIFSS